MKHAFRALLGLLMSCNLFFAACGPKKSAVVETPPTPPVVLAPPVDTVPRPPVPVKSLRPEKDLFVEIARGGCRGRCPIYKLQIFRDGRVLYHALEFLPQKGWFSGKIDGEKLEAIRERARAIGYLGLSNQYPETGPVIADFPICVTFIRLDGQEKEVRNRHHAPTELTEFEQFLDDMFLDFEWTPAKGPNEE
jgi:hypothetical protein